MDKAKLFIMWLDGKLDGKTTLNEEDFKVIKERLNGIFDHEALDSVSSNITDWEPNFNFGPESQIGGPDGNGETYRC